MTRKDTLYASPCEAVGDFVFDSKVVGVFEDMLNRSIPGYATVVHQTGAFARTFVRQNSHIYDLGCSLGAATFSIRHSVVQPGCTIVAVDNSRDMIHRMNKNLERDVGVVPVITRCEDILGVSMENASMVVLNFTLQFLKPPFKDVVLQRIYDALLPGGALVLSEKVVFEDPRVQRHVETLYYDFKRHNGYNELEICQKRDALENVLCLESVPDHVARLHEMGFSSVHQWYENLNFASFLALK